MAQEPKTPLTPAQKVQLAAAIVISLGTLGGSLMWGFDVLHEAAHREHTRRDLCDKELTGDPEKDEPLITARQAMGGCS